MAAAFLAGTAAFSQNVQVSFDLNYTAAETVAPVSVPAGRMLPAEAKTYPTREGYRFGGWYTTPECKPEQEWRFGNNASFFVPATDSMKVEKSMTLYAKWVAPKTIRTVEELDAIREDLYGWYVLENDLDLSGIANWNPIGEYEGPYEFAPAEWWRHAFKGVFDGQGHTLRGLRITELRADKAGLFGTMADGEIKNLNLVDSRITITAERPYVAPLVGIIKQDKGIAAVRNCTITGTFIQAKTTNTEGTFHSFTGLCGGIWGGILENNTVSGTMDLEIAGNGGGELYVGAYAGEAYNDTRNCTSDFNINIRFTQAQKNEYKAFVGGLQASATNVENCSATGSIRISGESGSKQIYVGGLVGSERYGTVSGSNSTVQIEVADMGYAQVGGVVGEFNATYGTMGSAFGVTTTKVTGCSYAGTPVFRNVSTPVFGQIAGAGEPAPLTSFWGPSMSYKIEDCTYHTSPLEGAWYGLYCGSPASATFHPDGSYAIWSEAFSSMNMGGSYTLEGNRLSLGGIPQMEGKGLAIVEGDKLELLLLFGAQGTVQAPVSLADGAGNPAATRLSLCRDKSVIEKATAKVEVPAEAALAFERNRRLGTGVNLNATLDGLNGNEPVKPGTIQKIAKAGFKSVRLPILWAAHTSEKAPYTIDPAFLQKVDAVVDECIAQGLAVILDNHYYPLISFGFSPKDLSYQDNIDRLYSIWQQLSAHYKDYSDEMLYFGLLNEPSLDMAPALWNEIIASCVKIIRHDNPGKTLTVGTPSLGQHWTIGLLEFPADEWNIIVDTHYYLPQTFTHQGIAFAMAGDIKDVPWMSTEADKAPLEQDFAFLARWSERNGRPVSIGEYGACDNADNASRARYIGFIQSQARQYGFSSMIWAFYRDGFSIYDDASGKWNKQMLKALKLK